MDFKTFKEQLLKNAKDAQACNSEYKRASQAESIEELIEIIKDNFSFVRDNGTVTREMSEGYEKPELFNIGKENTGLFNSGDRNSGYRNSGDLNSGYRNSGDLNSGDRNSGDLNSGDRNSGDLNSGYRNSGYRNSGDRNSGYRNSGDLNSGYRNSGVFCTRNRNSTVPFFNKESSMTWDEWYNHKAYDISCNLNITSWFNWSDMTDKEKKENPKAFVCEGYVKTYTYTEAWVNLWENLTEEEKVIFKTLPNFDSKIFEEITGIKF